MLNNVRLLIYSTLLFTPPLLISALACNLTTCSGIINIGLDGFMTLGAFIGCTATYFFHNTLLGFLFAGVITSMFSIVFAVLVLKLKINEILVGFVFNIFIPAAVVLVCYKIFGSSDTKALTPELKLHMFFTTCLSLMLVFIADFMLKKTNIGLYMRACSSNKLAAKYVGIDTTKLQCISIIVSGFFYGLSGAIVTMSITNQYKMTSICGQGYIALAAVLFGESKPINIMIYCLAFGFFSGLKTIVPSNSAFVHLIQIVPYVATIIILLIKYILRRKNGIIITKKNPV